jgi:pimeloyl-ACP methyl ester carboxylesterase
VTAAAVASALVLAACIPDREQVSPTTGPDAPSAETTPRERDVSALYEQSVEWERCGDLECATILAPVNWAQPSGDTITLSLNRHPARSGGDRIGSLLINPGGPGGSGIALTEYFATMAGDELLDHYDVVGFDPRGVGESTPIACGTGEEMDAFYVEDPDITSQADVDAARDQAAAFAAQCRELSGPVIEHMGTASVARDMDLIRAVVGDEQLNYLGFSYGTQLGATYAQLFPDNVGRMVLDGAVDFLLPSEELSAGQAQGFERSLTNFIQWCLDESDCALDNTVDGARAQIRELALQARDEGFESRSMRPVNGNLMVYGIVVTLYDEASWPYLKLALNELIETESASIIYELANFYLERNGTTGEYQDNSMAAFTAVGCLDASEAQPWTIADVEDFQASVEELSPTFGWWFASGLGCEGWPFSDPESVTSLDAAATVDSILVVGTTEDPATPFAWSESLAERLDAPLLAWVGDGHTAYGRSNECIVETVDEFLVEGVLPDSGKRC